MRNAQHIIKHLQYLLHTHVTSESEMGQVVSTQVQSH